MAGCTTFHDLRDSGLLKSPGRSGVGDATPFPAFKSTSMTASPTTLDGGGTVTE